MVLFLFDILLGMDYFVVGLGNPGEKYTWTRHNIAWLALKKEFEVPWEYDRYLHADYVSTEIEGTRVHIVLPQTFMNESGKSVIGLQKTFSSFSPLRLIVVHDDIDLPFGTVRISYDRGSGGHNGIKSITHHLQSSSFIRIRIGLAKVLENGTQAKPAVLGVLSSDERLQLEQTVAPKVRDILTAIVKYGYQKAMNIHNSI